MKIKTIPIKNIQPAKYNPRKDLQPGDEEYEKLKRSIEEFDIVEPLVWNKRTGNLVGGHQRLKILIERGDTECEVSVVDLDDAMERALNLALNKIEGEWDNLKLHEIFLELEQMDFDLDITGFDIIEREIIHNDADPQELADPAPPEPPETPKSKLGDLYTLGRHRLLCGNATVKKDVERLMAGKKADMVFTDPPYGIDYSGGRTQVVRNKSYGKIKGDKEEDISEYIEAILRHTGKADCYICLSPINLKSALEVIPKYEGIIVWKKSHPGLGYQKIRRYCEFIIYLSNWKKRKSDPSEFDIWEIPTDNRKEYQHGTQKPVALSARAIRYSRKFKKVKIIMDLFGGSGSTLLASEQLKLDCYMMELDPRYIDVIIKRWEDFTGKKARKVKE